MLVADAGKEPRQIRTVIWKIQQLSQILKQKFLKLEYIAIRMLSLLKYGWNLLKIGFGLTISV